MLWALHPAEVRCAFLVMQHMCTSADCKAHASALLISTFMSVLEAHAPCPVHRCIYVTASWPADAMGGSHLLSPKHQLTSLE